ncbi:MAG: cupin domain-containing protein [Alphaproteobacteria bacterium]|nr:cupin domain-containing protein [Alphaproteobacteria bacterium]
MTHKLNTLLDEGLVLDAASGAAPVAVRVLAACQAELNDDAAGRLSAAETAFGALLECGPVAPVSIDLYTRTVAELGGFETAAAGEAVTQSSVFPRALERILSDGEPIVWDRRFGGMEEYVIHSLCEPGVHVRLLKLPVGWRAPEHAHGGDELTLVMSGAFRDEVGRYGPGEVCHAASGHMHRPVVDGEEACLCLVVEFGQLKPTNPILALADRVLGRLF